MYKLFTLLHYGGSTLTAATSEQTQGAVEGSAISEIVRYSKSQQMDMARKHPSKNRKIEIRQSSPALIVYKKDETTTTVPLLFPFERAIMQLMT